ncbi:NLRC3, partial [Symbiodinium necroappetens]
MTGKGHGGEANGSYSWPDGDDGQERARGAPLQQDAPDEQGRRRASFQSTTVTDDLSADAAEDTKESSDAGSLSKVNPKTGKDHVPEYDGKAPMRDYERRVRLYESATGVDPCYRAQKLMERLSGAAWTATEGLELQDLKHEQGVQRLLKHLYQELEPLEHLRVFSTLTEFYRDFKRTAGQEFVAYDMEFRTHLKRLEDIGAKLEGLTKAYWFLEKASLSSDLRKQVISASGGEYDYAKLRKALMAIVPKVKRDEEVTSTTRTPFRQWRGKGGNPRQVNATTEEDQDREDGDDEEIEQAPPEELEGELEVLLTQAARKRAEIEKARGFSRGESGQARESRIKEMKSRMACSACRAHGKTVFGHWHSDPECPYNTKKGSQDGSRVLAVVNEELSDSEDDDLVLPSNVMATSAAHEGSDEDQAPCAEVCANVHVASSEEPRRETLALSDTCCARTVAGIRWIEKHVALLRQRGESVFTVDEARPFRFGGGPRISSTHAVIMPIQLQGSRRAATIRVSVVDQEIPLLLSKTVLKQMGMVMDLERGTVEFNNLQTRVPLRETKAGLCGFQINNEPTGRRLDHPPHELATDEREIFIDPRDIDEQVCVVQGSACSDQTNPVQGSACSDQTNQKVRATRESVRSLPIRHSKRHRDINDGPGHIYYNVHDGEWLKGRLIETYQRRHRHYEGFGEAQISNSKSGGFQIASFSLLLGLSMATILAPKKKEEYVMAVASRCKVAPTELRAHTLDRLKELWSAVKPPRQNSVLPANWGKLDLQGLRELYSGRVVDDLGRDQDHHWARWSRSQVIMEIEMWAADAAEATQMDRDLEMTALGPLCTLCHIPMMERTTRLTKEPFWGCRRFPVCKTTLPYLYDGRATKQVQEELQAKAKQDTINKEKNKPLMHRERPKPRRAKEDQGGAQASSDGSWVRTGPIKIDHDTESSQDESGEPKINTNLTPEEAELIQQMRVQKKAQATKIGKGTGYPSKIRKRVRDGNARRAHLKKGVVKRLLGNARAMIAGVFIASTALAGKNIGSSDSIGNQLTRFDGTSQGPSVEGTLLICETWIQGDAMDEDDGDEELIPDLEEPHGDQRDHHMEDQVPVGRRLSEAIRQGLIKVQLDCVCIRDANKENHWGWCKWAGPPMRVTTDLEGGFVGTAHFQAGKIERHNQTIKDMMFATIRQTSPIGREDMRKLSREVAWAKNCLVREHGWAPVALVFGREPRVFGELYHEGNPSAYHPSVGEPGSDVAVRMRYRYHAKMEFVRSQARQMLLKTAHNRARKLPVPKIGQLVFFWRAGNQKKGESQSKWLGPAYVVGLQDRNAWVAVGGRCFLVAGEHLREAVGDEKFFGDPEIQKTVALFKKIPKEATYEDLIGQEDRQGEPMDVETQPLNRDLTDELMMDEDTWATDGLS